MTVATFDQPLPPPGFREFRILPAGVFRTNDGSGRPANLSGWIMNGTIAGKIIAGLVKRDDVLIDYEHQSMRASDSGKPTPAAGWFKRVEWREGDGLYAVDVRWTDRAAAMIRAREYRYISPVFTFNGLGEVLNIVSVGLVNTPALAGLTDLAAASAMLPRQRDTDRAIDAFNAAFGMVGVYHPDTSPHAIATLKAKNDGVVTPAKPKLAGVPAEDAAKLRHAFPGGFD